MLNIGHLVVLHDAGMMAALEVPETLISVLKQELDSKLRILKAI